jgi:hypothetical protein
MTYTKPTINTTRAVAAIQGAPKSIGAFDNLSGSSVSQTNPAYGDDE